jgi:hypothetical protein
MVANTVYIRHADPALPDGWSLTGPMPDELLGLSPLELEDERGRYEILMHDAASENDAAVYRYKVEIIDRRIARYQKLGVCWPDRAGANELVDVARDLKTVVSLEQFVADHVMTTRLERAGDRWKGHCPIPTHDDQTPSFVVYPDGGWTCFGKCNRSGDIYTLIGMVFGLELFRDQVALLADYYGREVS